MTIKKCYLEIKNPSKTGAFWLLSEPYCPDRSEEPVTLPAFSRDALNQLLTSSTNFPFLYGS